jgi:hypothetical protein
MARKGKGKGKPARRPGPRPQSAASAGGAVATGGTAQSESRRSLAEVREAKRKARQQRQEAARRARRRQRLRRYALIAVIVTAAAALGGGLFYQNRRDAAQLEAALTVGSYVYDQESDDGRDHVANPSYEVNPPAGGPHLAAPARPGIYTGPSVPPTGALVHSLEHGAVILWYQPGLDPADLATLKSLADRFPDDVLLVERESLPTTVAATAWHQRLLGDTVKEKPLVRFITEFRDQGPENIPE